MHDQLFHTRLTGILIIDGKILIVKQTLLNRDWSLPGGRLQRGETISEGVVREIWEETGITTEIIKLLYVCDYLDVVPPVIHITFLLRKIGGAIVLPTNEFDENPISDVKFVDIGDLVDYGFSELFRDIVKSDFPNSGSYAGPKTNIGL